MAIDCILKLPCLQHVGLIVVTPLQSLEVLSTGSILNLDGELEKVYRTLGCAMDRFSGFVLPMECTRSVRASGRNDS